MLMQFGSNNLVDSEKESNEKDPFEDLNRLLYHEKSSIAICSLGMINNILKEYAKKESKLNHFDKNLLKSFFRNAEDDDLEFDKNTRN
jgi:hypothetical protein